MKQSEITTIQRTINARIDQIANASFPAPREELDGNAEITKALVHGKAVKMKSAADIRKLALNKIAHGGYSSDRSFRFADIFECSEEIEAAQRAAHDIERKREKLRLKLKALESRVIVDCKLGKFDVEQGAALDTFETKAADLVAA